MTPTLKTYTSMRRFWLDYWLSFGNYLSEDHIDAGINSLEFVFNAAGIDTPLSLTPTESYERTLELLADACREGAWDDVAEMVDGLFHRHRKAAS